MADKFLSEWGNSDFLAKALAGCSSASFVTSCSKEPHDHIDDPVRPEQESFAATASTSSSSTKPLHPGPGGDSAELEKDQIAEDKAEDKKPYKRPRGGQNRVWRTAFHTFIDRGHSREEASRLASEQTRRRQR